MLLSGPPGIGKTTVDMIQLFLKPILISFCHQLCVVDYYVINGSDEGQQFLGVDYLIRSEIMQKISLRPYHFRQLLNTKSSSSMRLITQQTTYNSYLGRLLRSFMATADSSSPATTKTKSSNHFIPVAQWLNSELGENKNLQSQPSSSNDSKTSSTPKELSMTTKSLSNSSTNTSQTGAVSSTSANDTLWVVKLIRGFLRLSKRSQ